LQSIALAYLLVLFSCCLDDEHWVTSSRIWTDIFTGGWIKQACVVEKASSNKDVFQIARLQPNLKGFGWETAIAHGQDTFTTWSQDTADFFEYLERFVEIIDWCIGSVGA